MSLQEAIETAEFWLDMWSDELVNDLSEKDEYDSGSEEEKKAIQAMRVVIAAAKRGIGT